MTDNITSSTPDTSIIDFLAGQSLTFNLLGKLLYEFPELAPMQALADDGTFNEIPFAGSNPNVVAGLALLQQWGRDNRDGQLAAHLDDLRVDHTRLFLGPGKVLAPPWESVQTDEQALTFQKETLEVRNWYRRFGLESVRLHQEPDDHVGLELAFIAHLAHQALLAHEEGDTARADQLLAAERDFVSAHPARWVPAFCNQVETHARTPFYRGLAKVTRGALAELSESLKDVGLVQVTL